jgi:hypothetical protein
MTRKNFYIVLLVIAFVGLGWWLYRSYFYPAYQYRESERTQMSAQQCVDLGGRIAKLDRAGEQLCTNSERPAAQVNTWAELAYCCVIK